MAEEIGTTDVVTDVTTEPTPNITSFIDKDGDTFKEGWRNFVPEDIRSEAVFDRAKTVSGVFKSLASHERMIGKDKVAIPNENSGEEEWDAFHRAGGRPDTPMELKRPDGIPEEMWNVDDAKMFSELFHKAGLSKKQTDMIMTAYNESTIKLLNDQRIDTQLAKEKADKELHEKWPGDEYKANMHAGNLAIEKGVAGDEELKARILEKYGNDPDFIMYSRNLGVNFQEGGTIIGDTQPGSTFNVADAINDLRSTDAYKNKMNPGHKDALKKMSALYEKKAGK